MNWFVPKSKVGLVWVEGWWDGGANAGLRRSVNDSSRNKYYPWNNTKLDLLSYLFRSELPSFEMMSPLSTSTR